MPPTLAAAFDETRNQKKCGLCCAHYTPQPWDRAIPGTVSTGASLSSGWRP